MWSCDPAVTGPILDTYEVLGPLFVGTLQTILAAQCALVGDHVWPPDASHRVYEDPEYDFIVVGAGSAGSVVANRLSEVPEWKVLLIEAGGNPTLATELPQLFMSNVGSSLDWGYKTQPQQGACRSFKTKQCSWPRGKVLGGCSSINAMFYVRGNRLDYDEWASAGNYGWRYADVLKYFQKSENLTYHIDIKAATKYGRDGYMKVEFTKNIHDFENMLIAAHVEQGLKYREDTNTDAQMGVTRSVSTTHNGVRSSTARAYLSPIKNRENFHVMKNAEATEILFDDNTNRAVGVLVYQNGTNLKIYAKKEVIVSAGSINTPKLLLLSGIGPKTHLYERNIRLKSDLPVGTNLQDHLWVPVYFTTGFKQAVNTLEGVTKGFFEFIIKKSGILSDVSPHKIVSFINTTDFNSQSPDIQYHYLFFMPNQSDVLDMYERHGISNEYLENIKKLNSENILLNVFVTLLRPQSRGRIRLSRNDPFIDPIITSNYFDNPNDMKTIMNGMKWITKLENTKQFKQMGFKLQWMDLEACKTFEKGSDEHLECIARETTFSLYHPVGTAKMGPIGDPTTVVDPELKVVGVNRLRVIDASIMPTITRGNTNAPAIMIGEKGADMVKQYWLNKREEL